MELKFYSNTSIHWQHNEVNVAPRLTLKQLTAQIIFYLHSLFIDMITNILLHCYNGKQYICNEQLSMYFQVRKY